MRPSEKIRLVASIVVFGSGAVLLFHLLRSLGTGENPFGAWTGLPTPIWGDWRNDWVLAWSLFAPGLTRPAVVYSPLAELAYAPWSFLPMAWGLVAQAGVFLYAVVRWTCTYVLDGQRPTARLVLVTVGMSFLPYPVVLAVSRGNLEMLTFALLAVFAILYYLRPSRWAGVFLGAAAAVKLYPALLLVIPIAERRWRDAVTALASLAGLTVGSILVLSLLSGRSPGDIVGLWMGTLGLHAAYPASIDSLPMGHSLWAVAALWLHRVGRSYAEIRTLTRPYVAVSGVLAAALGTYAVVVERVPWRRLLVIVAAMLLLPLISHDYRLVHILLPLGLYVRAAPARYDRLIGCLMAALLIPLGVFPVYADVSVSNLLYPAILVVLVATVMVDGFTRRDQGGSSGGVT